MSLQLAFLEEALDEAAEALEYLERARPGRGLAFKEALADAFDRIVQSPEIGASAEFANATRRWKLARFPSSVINILTEG